MQRLFFFIIILLSSCSNNSSTQKSKIDEALINGAINISVDESFKPVIDEQLKVFLATNPKAKIIVYYKSEADCFRDLLKDSTRLVIVSRGLTRQETEYYYQQLSFKPYYNKVAYDAVAAIVNSNNTDSIFSISTLKNILSGAKKYSVILDGVNATSTVKFLQDSVLKGSTFGANVMAVNGSDSVIEAVKKNKQAIGFVGNSWVSNTYNEKQIENLKSIKLALIECLRCTEQGVYAKASQATLTYGQYPLARSLYYIVKENWNGVGSKFGDFLTSEQGQLIFRRSCLLPAKMNFNKRQTKL